MDNNKPIKAVLFVGGNAPTRESELYVHSPYPGVWDAYYEPGYAPCSDPDCDCRSRLIVGTGKTADEAKADYWEQWEDQDDGMKYRVISEGHIKPEDDGMYCESGGHPMSAGQKFYILKEVDSVFLHERKVCEECKNVHPGLVK